MSTAMAGLAATIARVASMPFTPGIFTSISTTSGARAAAIATASSPLPASATTSVAGSESNSPWTPSRNKLLALDAPRAPVADGEGHAARDQRREEQQHTQGIQDGNERAEQGQAEGVVQLRRALQRAGADGV